MKKRLVTEPVHKTDHRTECPRSRDPRGFHNFPSAGSDCTYCGVNQNELSGRKLRRMDSLFGEK